MHYLQLVMLMQHILYTLLSLFPLIYLQHMTHIDAAGWQSQRDT